MPEGKESSNAWHEVGPASSSVQSRREISSIALFDGGREIRIRHADKIYTLRQTSKGKLILTK
jgi:hemin uptake protein HemP